MLEMALQQQWEKQSVSQKGEVSAWSPIHKHQQAGKATTVALNLGETRNGS